MSIYGGFCIIVGVVLHLVLLLCYIISCKIYDFCVVKLKARGKVGVNLFSSSSQVSSITLCVCYVCVCFQVLAIYDAR